jgi:hypothetical protein
MWARGYMVFGVLVLFGYALSSWEGWEPFSRRIQPLPVLSGGGGGSSGRAPGSGYSSHAGPSGFGGGK